MATSSTIYFSVNIVVSNWYIELGLNLDYYIIVKFSLYLTSGEV